MPPLAPNRRPRGASRPQELSLAPYGIPVEAGVSPHGERSQLKLGRYEVVRELGKGAMGVVYLAKDPLIGRLVALKTIRPAAGSDDDDAKEFQQRFVREAQAAGILNHPSIVTVHDIGQDDISGVSFIAMEYVEGQNLKELLSQGRPLTFEQIGDIIAQIADGLDFAHAKGIVHRDVKPANIIILEGLRAKITDFGIAKITSGGNLTTTGQFLGTPNYMAPEQIKGAPVDGRTDLFSLGICLYECLTHRKPFGGDSLTSISYKIVHESFPPLHEINPQIPEGFEEVVAQCLAKEPGKRYQRGREVAAALRAVIRGERPVKPPDPLLADTTLVTRMPVGDKTPTIEIPFPEASGPNDGLGTPRDTVPQPSMATPSSTQPAPKRVRPRVPPRDMLKNTLSGVRTHPLWKRSVPPLLFLIIVAAIAIPLVAAVVAIRQRQPKIPVVDTRLEGKTARERQLRTEGNEALHQGRVDDAFKKFSELNRLAPQSPYVITLLQKLSMVRQQEEVGKQQASNAKRKFDQGLIFYSQKRYPEAIALLSESFSLNPNAEDTAHYLELAQQQQTQENAEKARAKAQNVTATARTSTAVAGTAPGTSRPATAGSPQSGSASLTTIFNSAVNDGYIMVKAGGEVVAHENLWEDTGRFFKRRSPRQVNVTKAFAPKSADLEIWIVIPSLAIQEHRVIARQVFQAGANHRLLVTFDPQGKKFDYQLN